MALAPHHIKRNQTTPHQSRFWKPIPAFYK
jgi:hypothetical protein